MDQTIQQQRAKYAMSAINQAKKDGVNQGEFKSYASALPAMIHMNGLGQAAAFFRMKRGTHETLYRILSEWLCADGRVYGRGKDLLEEIANSDMHAYRLAQAEAQALMDWVKKFAKAFMQDEAEKGNHD
ncbi:MAG: type III-B CRISPR module-associated protein Cmr5 [gamma proteobacterium endosymbiont of Lamellibrachia anaximandri]|nr:type III-B CRISPR module-associated protein Cmr5 [gamma proteobacterium endosymbiont of Lamellibrachia anaximandri]MBL3535489.1 type III-B CRISPR module-associated protein Cmr5 [gamma proteobacterium endosymbiont of Lamellibrachia anaximandri]